MKPESVTVNKVAVTVNAVRLDSKRMTKQIFDQIPFHSNYVWRTISPFKIEEFSQEVQVLGRTVAEPSVIPILYVVDGELYKAHLEAGCDSDADMDYARKFYKKLASVRDLFPYLYIGA